MIKSFRVKYVYTHPRIGKQFMGTKVVRSKHLNGAVRKAFQMYPIDELHSIEEL